MLRRSVAFAVALGLALCAPFARADEPYFPFLDDEPRDQSISVGDSSHGSLVGGRKLEPDATLDILPRQRERGLAYGTSELCGLLRHAAGELSRTTGTKLWLGNLSRQGGGDIGWSVSHNSGRDADVALSYLDAKGRPVDPPDLVPLIDGVDRKTGLRFDPARTWIVIKALLTYRGAQVQYLFLSSDLRSAVLTHARKRGEPAKLIERAAQVVRHPVGAGAHNDHLHVRIYCSERDVLGGCRNLGVLHPGVALYEQQRGERTRQLVARLAPGKTASAELRRRLIERLVLLDARGDVATFAAALEDEAPAVRVAAARALAALGGPAEVALLARRASVEADRDVRRAVVVAVGDLGGEAAGAFLREAVGEPTRELGPMLPSLGLLALGEPSPLGLVAPLSRTLAGAALLIEREHALPPFETLGGPALFAALEAERELQRIAVDAAGRSERLEPSARLVELLADRDPALRAAAERALARATNLRLPLVRGGKPLAAGDEPTLEETAERLGRWREIVRRRRAWPRHGWLSAGFATAGFKVPQLEPKHAWELVRAVAGEEHVSYNAQRVLMRIAKEEAPTLTWKKEDACGYWLRFFQNRRKQYRLDAAPRETLRACAAAAHVD